MPILSIGIKDNKKIFLPPALSCLERVPPAGGGCGGDPYRIKPGFVEWERFFPLIRHALRRATFPGGEGDLRRGLPTGGGVLLPSPEGKATSGGGCLPAGAFSYLPRGGRLPPAGAAYRRGRSLTFPWGKVAASAAGRGAVPGRTPVPPHTRHACGVPPSPKERA